MDDGVVYIYKDVEGVETEYFIVGRINTSKSLKNIIDEEMLVIYRDGYHNHYARDFDDFKSKMIPTNKISENVYLSTNQQVKLAGKSRDVFNYKTSKNKLKKTVELLIIEKYGTKKIYLNELYDLPDFENNYHKDARRFILNIDDKSILKHLNEFSNKKNLENNIDINIGKINSISEISNKVKFSKYDFKYSGFNATQYCIRFNDVYLLSIIKISDIVLMKVGDYVFNSFLETENHNIHQTPDMLSVFYELVENTLFIISDIVFEYKNKYAYYDDDIIENIKIMEDLNKRIEVKMGLGGDSFKHRVASEKLLIDNDLNDGYDIYSKLSMDSMYLNQIDVESVRSLISFIKNNKTLQNKPSFEIIDSVDFKSDISIDGDKITINYILLIDGASRFRLTTFRYLKVKSDLSEKTLLSIKKLISIEIMIILKHFIFADKCFEFFDSFRAFKALNKNYGVDFKKSLELAFVDPNKEVNFNRIYEFLFLNHLVENEI